MARYFNTEGRCRPDKHYMVRLDERLKAIKERFVDREKYFVINRGRQYGKMTTLMALAEYLKKDYIVVSMDFQKIGSEEFRNAETFVYAFAKMFVAAFSKAGIASDEKERLVEPLADFADSAADKSLRELFVRISGICVQAGKPVVLIENEEYGYCSLIKAANRVLEKMKIENATKAKVTSTKRIEKNLVEPVPMREALINAIVHNDLSQEIPPVFEILATGWSLRPMGD